MTGEPKKIRDARPPRCTRIVYDELGQAGHFPCNGALLLVAVGPGQAGAENETWECTVCHVRDFVHVWTAEGPFCDACEREIDESLTVTRSIYQADPDSYCPECLMPEPVEIGRYTGLCSKCGRQPISWNYDPDDLCQDCGIAQRIAEHN